MSGSHTDQHWEQAAHSVLERAEELARCSEEPHRLTRPWATPAMRLANDMVAGWMRAAGMEVYEDNIGNLRGRYPARSSKEPSKTLLLGSHLDSVRDAGKYDGPLGVLLALATIEQLHRAGVQLPYALELIAFADEEGLRFHTSYLGSSVIAGKFDPAWLQTTDADGVTMAEAIQSFGGDPAALVADRRKGDDLLGYCEVHIEQGPVLEQAQLPVGVVDAIAGQSRFTVRFHGQAGHAGTVPMDRRHDALCAAAEWLLTVERLARAPGLVATVGQLTVEPGASNVIPGLTTLSLDVRHADDSIRQRACTRLQQAAETIGAARGITVDWQLVQANTAVPCSPQLTQLLARAVTAEGCTLRHLTSGAGHDGVALAGLTPIAMLFVRCQGGISHNPAEAVTHADVAVALAVLNRFLLLLADEQIR